MLSNSLRSSDNCCFPTGKDLKLTPESTKKQKTTQFLKFYAIFVKISTDFVDKIVKNTQNGTNLLSSRFFWRFYCSFADEKRLKVAPKMTKTQNFPIFEGFTQSVSKF